MRAHGLRPLAAHGLPDRIPSWASGRGAACVQRPVVGPGGGAAARTMPVGAAHAAAAVAPRTAALPPTLLTQGKPTNGRRRASP